MAQKLTYENKVAINVNPSIPDINKCNATDMNEIKNVVNLNADELDTKTRIYQGDTPPDNPEVGTLWIDTNDTENLAKVDSEVSTTSTNAIQNKAITEYVNSIIESEDTDNGRYIKYRDGTMICTKRIYLDSDSIIGFNPIGSLFLNIFDLGVTPATFTRVDHINVSATGFDNNYVIISNIINYSNSSFGNVCVLTGTQTAFRFYADCLMIGKWK